MSPHTEQNILPWSCLHHHTHTLGACTLLYRNYPFFVVEIFFGSTRYPKICYSNIFPVRRIFSIEILLFIRWLMVVPFIDHGNSAPEIRVGGLFRARQSFPTAACHLSLYTWQPRTKLIVPLFQLSWWKRTVLLLAARIRSNRFVNLDKRAPCSPPACVFEIFLIGNVFGWLRPSEIYSLRNIFSRKLSERKNLNYGIFVHFTIVTNILNLFLV